MFALGAVILRAFENAAWPANIRGVQRGVEAGGLVCGLLVDEAGTDSPGVAQKCTTDVVITDHLEKQLGDIGFIPAVPLLRCAVCRVLLRSVHSEAATHRSSSGRCERKVVVDDALHAVRVTLCALHQGHGTRSRRSLDEHRSAGESFFRTG